MYSRKFSKGLIFRNFEYLENSKNLNLKVDILSIENHWVDCKF